MVVAEDVLDRKGRVLIPRGAELSERTLEALTGWGVDAIQVEGEVDAAPLDPAALAEARSSLAGRFMKTDVNHPVVAAVLDRAAQQLVRSGRSQETVASDAS
ncbi:MAG: hypothetical protein HKO53_00435 [Gemmatimonadetes bacterium]|nr:hypothetical protein [Gemmatimonadota bacterium]